MRSICEHATILIRKASALRGISRRGLSAPFDSLIVLSSGQVRHCPPCGKVIAARIERAQTHRAIESGDRGAWVVLVERDVALGCPGVSGIGIECKRAVDRAH